MGLRYFLKCKVWLASRLLTLDSKLLTLDSSSIRDIENELRKAEVRAFSGSLFEMPLGPPSGSFKTGFLGLGLLDPD